ncbi:hypothetical protein BaRGS_00019132 [Batillaria attramentaria]|uniref:Uncharacterized protein n=1 Tax=Batillaria attramentaria TaxID=370345 RepID=A0ABD0KR34_9CAEN
MLELISEQEPVCFFSPPAKESTLSLLSVACHCICPPHHDFHKKQQLHLVVNCPPAFLQETGSAHDSSQNCNSTEQEAKFVMVHMMVHMVHMVHITKLPWGLPVQSSSSPPRHIPHLDLPTLGVLEAEQSVTYMYLQCLRSHRKQEA